MNGRSFLIDTNIALYLLGGDVTITNILDNSTIYLSFITQLELLGYSG
jgi:predicted nucleic acid-binding protein